MAGAGLLKTAVRRLCRALDMIGSRDVGLTEWHWYVLFPQDQAWIIMNDSTNGLLG